MRAIRYFVPLMAVLLLGCYQDPDDPDNAIVSGYVYCEYVIESDSCAITCYNPVESVQVFIESDIESEIPYEGPDIIDYSDANGFFSIPVYLGHTEVLSNNHVVDYDYVSYADVSVLLVYKGVRAYDYGGGVTLGRGEEFRLWNAYLSGDTWEEGKGD